MGLVEDLTGEAADPGLVIDLDASLDSSAAHGESFVRIGELHTIQGDGNFQDDQSGQQRLNSAHLRLQCKMVCNLTAALITANFSGEAGTSESSACAGKETKPREKATGSTFGHFAFGAAAGAGVKDKVGTRQAQLFSVLCPAQVVPEHKNLIRRAARKMILYQLMSSAVWWIEAPNPRSHSSATGSDWAPSDSL